MVGIVSGGVVGGPVATWLIARRRLATPKATPVHIPLVTAQSIVEEQMHEAPARAPEGEDREAYTLLKTLVVMLVAMWVGGVISAWINRTLAGVGMVDWDFETMTEVARRLTLDSSGDNATEPGFDPMATVIVVEIDGASVNRGTR